MMSAADTLALLGWRLEDFNQEMRAEPAAPLEESGDPGAEPGAEPEVETGAPVTRDDWTDGYMHAARHISAAEPARIPKAELLEALHELEERLVESVEEASLLVARLMLEAVATHGHVRWAGTAAERIERMSELVRPALMSAMPRISVRSCDGETIALSAEPCVLAAPGAAEGTAKLADHITLSWHLGKAEAGWTATLRERAAALAPLMLDRFTVPDPKHQPTDAA
jgi:hypothetical protein